MPRLAKHIAFWVVCLVLSALLTGIQEQFKGSPDPYLSAFIGELLIMPVKIGLTYFTFYYLLPLYLDRRTVWKLIGLFLLALLVAAILYRLILLYYYFPAHYPDRPRFFFDPRGWLQTVFDIFTVTTAATSIKLIRLHYKNRDFEQQLRQEKLQSELSFLRAQTNPHFLFNTLNNLYGLARRKSDQTADAILMLSKIMRFVLYECRSPRIPIEEEVKVIRDYIELEKLRYTDRLVVNFEEKLDVPDMAIAPLMLLPFVENSFKHGASGSTGTVNIDIRLVLKDEFLVFEIKNSVETPIRQPNSMGENGSGIGLKNVRRQLELIYSDQYKLEILPREDCFFVKLEIQLGN